MLTPELFNSEIACIVYNYSNGDWNWNNGCFSGLRKAIGFRGVAELTLELIAYASLPFKFYSMPELQPISQNKLRIKTLLTDRDELISVTLSADSLINFAQINRHRYSGEFELIFSQEFTEMELIYAFECKAAFERKADASERADTPEDITSAATDI